MSKVDAVVLLLGAIGCAVLCFYVGWPGMLIAFVTGHFFLFCNVFRVSRSLELTWAGIFVAMSAATILLYVPGWPVTLGLALVATIVVIAVSLRQPSYHGTGWQRFNPNLPQWWAQQDSRSRTSSSLTAVESRSSGSGDAA